MLRKDGQVADGTCPLFSMDRDMFGYPVNNKNFHRMFQVLNECYKYAADEDRAIVPENLWQKAKKKINKALIATSKTPSDESQVFTDDDRRKIEKMVYSDTIEYDNRPTSAGLQILFLFQTALRMSECCGLKWSDIKNGRLYIQRQADNEGVREWTKTTNGYRDIPLTEEAIRILEYVKNTMKNTTLQANGYSRVTMQTMTTD